MIERLLLGCSALLLAAAAGTQDSPRPPIAAGDDELGLLLKKWHAAGEAAGNIGDLYQNMDGEHAVMVLEAHPQMKALPVQARPAYGWKGHAADDPSKKGAPVLANASMAAPSYCIPTKAMMTPEIQAAYERYLNNCFWFDPAHADYGWDDPDLGVKMDWFPGMIPYITASVGSSGTELDEMAKFAYALAALRPAVKKKLQEAGLIVPTLQMCFRRSRVAGDEEYLSGKAHPSAFDDHPNTMEMVQLAHSIQPGDIPPMIQLEVASEDHAADEKAFDTPAAIGRLFRASEGTRKITVSAGKSYDLNKRPLTYHWKLLRGDPKKVRIKTANTSGSEAVIEFDNHARARIEGTEIESHLVVVGVFVRNGKFYSAPGFVSSYNPSENKRVFKK